MNVPKCPRHNVEMVLRIAHKGKYINKRFWGCPTWHRTKCNIIYSLTIEDENTLTEVNEKKPDSISLFNKLKWSIKRIRRNLTESYYVNTYSQDFWGRQYYRREKTTLLSQIIYTIIILTIIVSIIVSYSISVEMGKIVLAIIICAPFTFAVFLFFGEIIKIIFNKLFR